MKIYSAQEYPQGSGEWWQVRRGIPTASGFDRILTPKTRKFSSQADDYICELIGDICQLNPAFFTEQGRPPSKAMENGSATEPEARRFFELDTGFTVTEVGFITTDDGKWGFSPDGLVGEDSGLELKCPLAKTQARYVLDGVLPPEYLAQTHGPLALAILDPTLPFKSWHFLSYCPGLPPLRLEVKPDDYTKALADALLLFDQRFQAAKARLLPKPLEPSPLSTEDNAELERWRLWLAKGPELDVFNRSIPDIAGLKPEPKKATWKLLLAHAETRGWSQSLHDPRLFVEV